MRSAHDDTWLLDADGTCASSRTRRGRLAAALMASRARGSQTRRGQRPSLVRGRRLSARAVVTRTSARVGRRLPRARRAAARSLHGKVQAASAPAFTRPSSESVRLTMDRVTARCEVAVLAHRKTDVLPVPLALLILTAIVRNARWSCTVCTMSATGWRAPVYVGPAIAAGDGVARSGRDAVDDEEDEPTAAAATALTEGDALRRQLQARNCDVFDGPRPALAAAIDEMLHHAGRDASAARTTASCPRHWRRPSHTAAPASGNRRSGIRTMASWSERRVPLDLLPGPTAM